jgi:hypothetical protein
MEAQSTYLHDTLTLPLDFWMWGHVKTLVYSEPIGDLKVLEHRLESACQELRENHIFFFKEKALS